MGDCFSFVRNWSLFRNRKRRRVNGGRIRKSEIFLTTKSGYFTNVLTVTCNEKAPKFVSDAGINQESEFVEIDSEFSETESDINDTESKDNELKDDVSYEEEINSENDVVYENLEGRV